MSEATTRAREGKCAEKGSGMQVEMAGGRERAGTGQTAERRDGEKVFVKIDGVQHQVAQHTGQSTAAQCLQDVAAGLTTLGLASTQANGVISVAEWPSNWEWDTPSTIAVLDCSGGEVAYRFGFNGKENDNEVYGASGTSYDYGFRIYDPRVARFLSVDPLSSKFAMLTPFQFASNTPIQAIDLDGLEARVIIKSQNDNTGEVRIRTLQWNQVPGSTGEHGPLGTGVLRFDQRVHGNLDLKAATYSEYRPSGSVSFDFGNLFSGMGGVWGTGDGPMRDKGKDGAAWDPQFFMMALGVMNKMDGFKTKSSDWKFNWDKYQSGRQDQIPDELIDKQGKLEEYSDPDMRGTTPNQKPSSTMPDADTLMYPNGDGFEVTRGDTNSEGKYNHVYRKVVDGQKKNK